MLFRSSGYEDAAVPPTLAITLADGLVELRWPTTFVGWQVYGAAAANAPPSAWTLAIGSLIQVGGQNVFLVFPGDSSQFFRLAKP